MIREGKHEQNETIRKNQDSQGIFMEKGYTSAERARELAGGYMRSYT